MVKSKKRKKSKKKLLIALLLTFLVLAASAAAVSNITITEMSVEGNKHYTKEEIRDILFGTAKERNTLYCFLNQKFGEPKDIPFVDRYDIEFSGLNRVDVIIYEKSVVGYIEYMGSYMYFDRDGIIVESSSKPTAGIPLVTGLDFDRIVEIKEKTGVPLVMHGGSGISVADTQRAIRCGIRKINYFSYMSNAGVRAVKELLAEKDVKYFHDLANAAVDGMEKDVLGAMKMFALE